LFLLILLLTLLLLLFYLLINLLLFVLFLFTIPFHSDPSRKFAHDSLLTLETASSARHVRTVVKVRAVCEDGGEGACSV
jgi:hypothetical protein